jgi:hypothetical protein
MPVKSPNLKVQITSLNDQIILPLLTRIKLRIFLTEGRMFCMTGKELQGYCNFKTTYDNAIYK